MAGTWVNVGSGLQTREGFENLDNSPFLRLAPVAPLISAALPRRYRTLVHDFARARRRGLVRRYDCTKPLPYQDGTVDHLLCSHMLEHLPVETVEKMLADFHRVLRPGGTLHVIVPDFRRMTEKYIRGEMTADEYQDWLIFHPRAAKSLRRRLVDTAGTFGLSHIWHYDAASGGARLESLGFSVHDFLETPSSDYRAEDDESLHLYATA